MTLIHPESGAVAPSGQSFARTTLLAAAIVAGVGSFGSAIKSQLNWSDNSNVAGAPTTHVLPSVAKRAMANDQCQESRATSHRAFLPTLRGEQRSRRIQEIGAINEKLLPVPKLPTPQPIDTLNLGDDVMARQQDVQFGLGR